MKTLFLLFLFAASFPGHSSEALRFAKHGCEVKKEPMACKIQQRLSKGADRQVASEASEVVTSNSTVEKEGVKVEMGLSADTAAMEKLMGECKPFGAHLKDCKPFECTYTHLMGAGKMKKRVVGPDGDKCKTEEEMPENELMTCNYSKDQVPFVAENSDTYGQAHSDKLSGYMNDGTCTFSK